MIVDDDPFNRYALTFVLRARGYECMEASRGIESIELLRKNPQIKVVLMDIMMPEMNGYDVIRKIREDEKYKDLCIIALTAKAMKGDRAKCMKAGASEYITKPVDVDRLIRVMKEFNKDL